MVHQSFYDYYFNAPNSSSSATTTTTTTSSSSNSNGGHPTTTTTGYILNNNNNIMMNQHNNLSHFQSNMNAVAGNSTNISDLFNFQTQQASMMNGMMFPPTSLNNTTTSTSSQQILTSEQVNHQHSQKTPQQLELEQILLMYFNRNQQQQQQHAPIFQDSQQQASSSMNDHVTTTGAPSSSKKKKKSKESASKKHIVRNKKVECSYNLQFHHVTLMESISSSDANIERLAAITKSNLASTDWSLLDDPIPPTSVFAVETDVENEAIETGILKHRKTIRFKITADLQNTLYYGPNDPHMSIYAYLYETSDPPKLHMYSTENMKGKKSRNIIKFDVYKKIKIASLITNFHLGLVILEQRSATEKTATVHILNSVLKFDKMMDNDKKRKDTDGNSEQVDEESNEELEEEPQFPKPKKKKNKSKKSKETQSSTEEITKTPTAVDSSSAIPSADMNNTTDATDISNSLLVREPLHSSLQNEIVSFYENYATVVDLLQNPKKDAIFGILESMLLRARIAASPEHFSSDPVEVSILIDFLAKIGPRIVSQLSDADNATNSMTTTTTKPTDDFTNILNTPFSQSQGFDVKSYFDF
ncbi:hypothetical protein C9374_001054 [Naegleria lovaniensis]|uniref:Uncharacterized protein n=1 Tax=Naegleria lovaniensis TaxID=51637 RepID=A0AA88GYV4_NAELO|nr:uncharacterized protein C9374_001054 [Naegleria lovaniensis]KAG2388204.1 hypothetical protein C9374_001054 [Naegleria lovaniensis]